MARYADTLHQAPIPPVSRRRQRPVRCLVGWWGSALLAGCGLGASAAAGAEAAVPSSMAAWLPVAAAPGAIAAAPPVAPSTRPGASPVAVPCSPAPGAEAGSARQDTTPSWGTPGWMRASDQRFILLMIPHHDAAIAMAELALVRGRHPELRALARRIAADQRRENGLMRDWYRQWYGTAVPALDGGRGLPLPGPGSGLGPGLGMGMGPGPGLGLGLGLGMGPGMGMGSGLGGGMGPGMALQGMETTLVALRSAPDFDRAFIEQMIPHHRMGVMMAAHALMGTDHRELRVLQQAMVRTQSQEIAQMAAWYRRWYGG